MSLASLHSKPSQASLSEKCGDDDKP